MVERIRRATQSIAVARPQWMPHPLLLNVIGALWLAALGLQILTQSHH
jgi:phosphatidylserine/phosphatidylglycerophosphate/cardiolipin synthase-like enzyme